LFDERPNLSVTVPESISSVFVLYILLLSYQLNTSSIFNMQLLLLSLLTSKNWLFSSSQKLTSMQSTAVVSATAATSRDTRLDSGWRRYFPVFPRLFVNETKGQELGKVIKRTGRTRWGSEYWILITGEIDILNRNMTGGRRPRRPFKQYKIYYNMWTHHTRLLCGGGRKTKRIRILYFPENQVGIYIYVNRYDNNNHNDSSVINRTV